MNDFWEFLESMRIPDAILAEGYEQAGPALRGHLKKNIAVQHELMEQRLPPEFKRTEVSYGATICAQTATPAPWCLIIHDTAYSAAPRALAAAVPAQLAATPVIWSVALHETNTPKFPPAPVLAAWELAGVENVAATNTQTFLTRLGKFNSSLDCTTAGPGRLLILGDPVWCKEVRTLFSNESKALVRQEGPPPRILLTGNQADAYHLTLNALHPDADLQLAQHEKQSPQNASETHAVVFSNEPFTSTGFDPALHMDYEHCGCWIWPELDVKFFLNHTFSLFNKP
jgi:hypothetical protein